MISRLDRDVGRILGRLKELGIDDRTVVFFTSDNGPDRSGGSDPDFFRSSGPLRGIKRDLYEGGIRAPMIARWPGRVPRGAVSAGVWGMWDFLPTAAEIAGARIPSGLDGSSARALLLGKERPAPEFLYWEFHERGFHQAVRHGDRKAVRFWSLSPETEGRPAETGIEFRPGIVVRIYAARQGRGLVGGGLYTTHV